MGEEKRGVEEEERREGGKGKCHKTSKKYFPLYSHWLTMAT